MRIIPTLEAMAEVYRLPRDGGSESPRFRRYIEVMRAEHVPAGGYNPMTSKPVLETVEALVTIDAESVALDAAAAAANALEADGEFALYLTVATPGLWTARLESEVEHRLAPRSWTGGCGSILLWTGEDTSAEAVARESAAQLVRAAWIAVHREPPRTTGHVSRQEGLAYAIGGDEGSREQAAAQALDVLGEDGAYGTKAAFLYGDEVAEALGFTPLGLAERAGYRHAIAMATEALERSTAAEFLRE
jgi:hypothetical protein